MELQKKRKGGISVSIDEDILPLLGENRSKKINEICRRYFFGEEREAITEIERLAKAISKNAEAIYMNNQTEEIRRLVDVINILTQKILENIKKI